MQKRPRKAGSREERQRGREGEGATRETDTQFRKARAGVCEPMGGWRPGSEVSSFPTRAVLAGDCGVAGSSSIAGSSLLAPIHSSLGDGSLQPHDNASFCHLPPKWPPTSSRLLAPPVSSLRGSGGSPEEKEKKYNRENNLSPAAPRTPSLPPTQLPQSAAAGGRWKWRHGMGRWQKQEAAKGWQTFPLHWH